MSQNIELIDFGHKLHMDTKQDIIFNGKHYNCIKGALLHKKRRLKEKTKCLNFNYYWLENRQSIIKNFLKEIFTDNKTLKQELKKYSSFGYIDNGNRNLGIGYYTINQRTKEVSWNGKNIIGNILTEIKEEI